MVRVRVRVIRVRVIRVRVKEEKASRAMSRCR
jgi:hypothetical protein